MLVTPLLGHSRHQFLTEWLNVLGMGCKVKKSLLKLFHPLSVHSSAPLSRGTRTTRPVLWMPAILIITVDSTRRSVLLASFPA